MNIDALVAQLRSQRTRTVEHGALTLRFEVPSVYLAVSITRAAQGGHSTGDELVRLLGLCLREWSGLTTADLLGAGVGSDEPVPYDPRVWAVVAGSRPDLTVAVANAVMNAVMEDQAQSEAVSGN